MDVFQTFVSQHTLMASVMRLMYFTEDRMFRSDTPSDFDTNSYTGSIKSKYVCPNFLHFIKSFIDCFILQL